MIVNFILGIVVPLILFIAGGYLVKTYHDDNVVKWVSIAVKAAEQMFAHGENEEKFEYVKKWVTDKFSISEADLKNIIESAVYELNKEKK